jgi:predicted NAD-dependent protein-ADP-ribosyltransferase YbiA (DUF1768 family)
MGGPCFIIRENNKKVLGPSATDNFQILTFTYPLNSDVTTWYSVEQCYQAHKFDMDSKTFTSIHSAIPVPDETDSEYGLRVWSLGQRGTPRRDWEKIKVEVMYLINCAKFACNRQIHQELLDTGNQKLIGGPSTWQWSQWNGRIQMLIRHKIQTGVNLDDIVSVTNEELLEMD